MMNRSDRSCTAARRADRAARCFAGVALGTALPAPARANTPGPDGGRDPQRRRARRRSSKGKVTLDLPPLVENGNTVSMSVTVD